MKYLKIVSLLALVGLSSFSSLDKASSFPPVPSGRKNAPKDHVTLSVYNWEDYISEGDENIIAQFEEYVLETDNVVIDVTYDTFDTNESMLSMLETGARQYDLICPSDYMIQRMMAKGLLEPFASGTEREAVYAHGSEGWEDYYDLYASPFLQEWFRKISSVLPTGETATLAEYARGYMWGTLGLVYNPEFPAFAARGLESDDVKAQLTEWPSMWGEQYRGTFQIKDSVRDTFAMATMGAYDEELSFLKNACEEGSLNGEPYSSSSYQNDVNTFFNNVTKVEELQGILSKIHGESFSAYTLDDVISRVEASLKSLKDNSFGMEVDSGKQDIVAGKSGIGLAWSGDAVYSMDLAEVEEGKTLYYSIPETGGNIWFDGWVMLDYPGLNKEYAQKFVDFISKPEKAALNMDYIGYTSFIAGEEIFDLVTEWYDARSYRMYAYLGEGTLDFGYHGFVYDEEGNPLYLDGTGVREIAIDGETYEVDFGDVDMRGSTYEKPVVDGTELASWDLYFEANEEEIKKVDLNYFFKGTVEGDTAIYSDGFEEVTGLMPDGSEKTVTVGRQLLAQYPLEESLPSLAVMEDYGDTNAYVLRMWEAVKSDSLSPMIIAILVTEVALFGGFFLALYIVKKRSKRLRKKRREN